MAVSKMCQERDIFDPSAGHNATHFALDPAIPPSRQSLEDFSSHSFNRHHCWPVLSPISPSVIT